MKATKLLTQQHKEVKALLLKLVDAKPGERRELFEDVASKLTAHDAIERQIFYPAVEAETGMTPILGEAIVEHGVIEFMLYRTDRALSGDEFPFEAKVLCESVLHHAGEEEADLFPEVEKAMDAKRLEELGQAMQLLFEQEVDKDFRIGVHHQLQQVLTGGMKTDKGLRANGAGRGSKVGSGRQHV